MRKDHEVADPKSCWNKANDDEIMFVLLARDIAAPTTIEAWVQERIRLGKNKGTDPQIKEAIECARRMREQQTRPQ